MSESVNPLSMMATTATSTSKQKNGSWYEAMAEAWGKTLDNKAFELENSSAELSAGNDTPSTVTMLQTQAMQMGFLSTGSHTAISSTGEALKSMAQKS